MKFVIRKWGIYPMICLLIFFLLVKIAREKVKFWLGYFIVFLSRRDNISLIYFSHNCLGWKRLLSSLIPAVNTALPSPPLNHALKSHICTSFKYLVRWQLNHFSGQPVPVLEHLSMKKFLLISNLSLP